MSIIDGLKEEARVRCSNQWFGHPNADWNAIRAADMRFYESWEGANERLWQLSPQISRDELTSSGLAAANLVTGFSHWSAFEEASTRAKYMTTIIRARHPEQSWTLETAVEKLLEKSELFSGPLETLEAEYRRLQPDAKSNSC
jgi:hypothetical protein